MRRQVFHTRHDFTPEFAWAAFQLLAQSDAAGLTSDQLQQVARAAASPLAKRAGLHKLLASLQELGLVERRSASYVLGLAGERLANLSGRCEVTFRAAVHCLYAWKWIWDSQPALASPSWSYRRVCSEILFAGPAGVEQDALVLRVVDAADAFRAEKVSFSRSSVHGVAMWLEAQNPPLIDRRGSRLFTAAPGMVNAGTAQFHLAALCSLAGGTAILDQSSVRLLAESWLLPPAEIMASIEEVCEFAGFDFILSTPPRVTAHSVEAALLAFIGAARNSQHELIRLSPR